jgi:hypothetical protein
MVLRIAATTLAALSIAACSFSLVPDEEDVGGEGQPCHSEWHNNYCDEGMSCEEVNFVCRQPSNWPRPSISTVPTCLSELPKAVCPAGLRPRCRERGSSSLPDPLWNNACSHLQDVSNGPSLFCCDLAKPQCTAGAYSCPDETLAFYCTNDLLVPPHVTDDGSRCVAHWLLRGPDVDPSITSEAAVCCTRGETCIEAPVPHDVCPERGKEYLCAGDSTKPAAAHCSEVQTTALTTMRAYCCDAER